METLWKQGIKKVEVLEYPELGMEAVWKIEVVDFPPFIVADDKGNDFVEAVTGSVDRPAHGLAVFALDLEVVGLRLLGTGLAIGALSLALHTGFTP